MSKIIYHADGSISIYHQPPGPEEKLISYKIDLSYIESEEFKKANKMWEKYYASETCKFQKKCEKL